MQKYHALARVFGSAGGLFGREDEQQVFSAVADAGLGPKVLVRFLHSACIEACCVHVAPDPRTGLAFCLSNYAKTGAIRNVAATH